MRYPSWLFDWILNSGFMMLDYPVSAIQYPVYQLAFVTPGILPCAAISRNIFLDIPK